MTQVVTERELSCAGSGQRASGAVILPGKAWPVEGLDPAIGREKLIFHQIAACLICAGPATSRCPLRRRASARFGVSNVVDGSS